MSTQGPRSEGSKGSLMIFFFLTFLGSSICRKSPLSDLFLDSFLLIQSITRMYQVRGHYRDCLWYFRDHVKGCLQCLMTDSNVNDPNNLLQVFTSLTYILKFPFVAFSSTLTTFPSTFYMSAEYSTNPP